MRRIDQTMNNQLDNKLAEKPQEGNVTPGNRVAPDRGRKPWVRCLMQVLWPAFMGAAITVGILFSLIDPVQIEWVQVHLNNSCEAAYTAGFILFWIIYTIACTMTWFLATTETPAGRPDRTGKS